MLKTFLHRLINSKPDSASSDLIANASSNAPLRHLLLRVFDIAGQLRLAAGRGLGSLNLGLKEGASRATQLETMLVNPEGRIERSRKVAARIEERLLVDTSTSADRLPRNNSPSNDGGKD